MKLIKINLLFVVILICANQPSVNSRGRLSTKLWKPTVRDWCDQVEFTQTASWTEKGPREFSNPLVCNTGSSVCGNTLRITKTFTKTTTHSDKVGISTGEIFSGVKLGFEYTFGTSLADATSTSVGYSCFANPGWKVRLALDPEFGVIQGQIKKKCCHKPWYAGEDDSRWDTCNTTEDEVTTKVPLKNNAGGIKGNYFCHHERI